MPRRWLEVLRRQNWAGLNRAERAYLPTRGLIELLSGVEPAVISVDPNPESDNFIVAFEGADKAVLTAAVAAWATTEVDKEFPGLRPFVLTSSIFGRVRLTYSPASCGPMVRPLHWSKSSGCCLLSSQKRLLHPVSLCLGGNGSSSWDLHGGTDDATSCSGHP